MSGSRDKLLADFQLRHNTCQVPVEECGLHAGAHSAKTGNSDKVPVLLLALWLRRPSYRLTDEVTSAADGKVGDHLGG